MQLQFEKREMSCLAQVVRAVKDQELTQEIRLTESMPDAGRVLAGWGQVILRGKEWQSGHLAVSGGVQAWVLYAPEDGSAPRTVDVWLPFQMKWEGAQTDREGPMRMRMLLRFVDGRNLSARKILVRAGISCLAEGLTAQRTEVYAAPVVPEDVQLLRRSYPVRLAREGGEKTFSLEEKLDAGADDLQQILSYSLQPELSEARVSGDKVALRGMGRLHLVYVCREGRIRSRDFEVPFSQLGELENRYESDAQADVMMAVTALEVDMEEDHPVLRCGLVAQYRIDHRVMLELVEDAYSPRREVGLRQEELYLPVILDETRERINAGAAFADLELDSADAVFWPGFPRVRREGDRVRLEIPGRFQLLGYDRDGTLHGSTANWEGESHLSADDSSQLDAVTATVGDVRWSMDGRGMEARAAAEICVTTQSRRGLPMLTGLELGELREPDRERPTLILCRPGRRNLWEIAKGAGTSADAIRGANGFDGEPEEDRMLLIPVQ